MDVESTIDKVAPTIVVLELDDERLKRLLHATQFGDSYGLERYKKTKTTQILGMALSGDLLGYASGLFYVCTGALMGTRPGGEFVTAAEAAERLGATLLLADRSQAVTMKRLQWYTRELMQADRPRRQWHTDSGRQRIEFPTRTPESVSTSAAYEAASETLGDNTRESASSERGVDEPQTSGPWGLDANDDDSSESAVKLRLLRMMREGGCPQPNAVLAAAQRLLRNGLDPGGSISPSDVLEVRQCGQTLIETFRRRALAGDDKWIKELEVESVAGGAKGALGAARSGMAMRKVIIDERDLILARRLWEAGERVSGQAIVGVVGAGHIRGIQKYWDMAGTEEAAAKTEEYCRLPPGEGPPSAAGMAITGGVLGYLAYRRPRAVALFVGVVTLATAPYLGFSVFTMKRLTAFAGKLAKTSELIEAEGGVASDGWPEPRNDQQTWQ